MLLGALGEAEPSGGPQSHRQLPACPPRPPCPPEYQISDRMRGGGGHMTGGETEAEGEGAWQPLSLSRQDPSPLRRGDVGEQVGQQSEFSGFSAPHRQFGENVAQNPVMPFTRPQPRGRTFQKHRQPQWGGGPAGGGLQCAGQGAWGARNSGFGKERGER